MRSAVFILFLISFLYPADLSAARQPRPLAGIGILTIREPAPQGENPAPSRPLFKEPGVGRIADLDMSDIPSIYPALTSPEGTIKLAVTRKQGGWVKVIFDDSGREGWLQTHRRDEFKTWEKSLKGKDVRLFHGLKKDHYQLRLYPASSSRALDTLNRDSPLRIIELDGSWMFVLVNFENSGWIRWKDDDGRLLITLEKSS